MSRATWVVNVKQFNNNGIDTEREYVLEDTDSDDLQYHISEILEDALEQGLSTKIHAHVSEGYESETGCYITGDEVSVELIKDEHMQ